MCELKICLVGIYLSSFCVCFIKKLLTVLNSPYLMTSPFCFGRSAEQLNLAAKHGDKAGSSRPASRGQFGVCPQQEGHRLKGQPTPGLEAQPLVSVPRNISLVEEGAGCKAASPLAKPAERMPVIRSLDQTCSCGKSRLDQIRSDQWKFGYVIPVISLSLSRL